jgi:hypothetical protein
LKLVISLPGVEWNHVDRTSYFHCKQGFQGQPLDPW